jgi:hypothetical protein
VESTTPFFKESTMKLRTNVKAGASGYQHNETLVRDPKSAGLRIKTHVRGGKKSLGGRTR